MWKPAETGWMASGWIKWRPKDHIDQWQDADQWQRLFTKPDSAPGECWRHLSFVSSAWPVEWQLRSGPVPCQRCQRFKAPIWPMGTNRPCWSLHWFNWPVKKGACPPRIDCWLPLGPRGRSHLPATPTGTGRGGRIARGCNDLYLVPRGRNRWRWGQIPSSAAAAAATLYRAPCPVFSIVFPFVWLCFDAVFF